MSDLVFFRFHRLIRCFRRLPGTGAGSFASSCPHFLPPGPTPTPSCQSLSPDFSLLFPGLILQPEACPQKVTIFYHPNLFSESDSFPCSHAGSCKLMPVPAAQKLFTRRRLFKPACSHRENQHTFAVPMLPAFQPSLFHQGKQRLEFIYTSSNF